MSTAPTAPGFLTRLVPVERGEGAALAWSFAYFFCVLCGYYILRPVRDAMGIDAGMDRLTWLFTATFLVMLAVVPVFGWLTARLPRARLLPGVYAFFALHLVVFWAALRLGAPQHLVGPVYFVWVTVFNVFVVSVFWSFMADLFTPEQAKRLYGFIAAGGTAGAVAGPLVTAALVGLVGPANLLLVSAGLLLAAVVAIWCLSAWAAGHEADRRAAAGEPVGGGVWAGLTTALASPYLLLICLYLLCYTLLSTLLYFQQADLVQKAFATTADRTAYFARVDLAVNVLTLLLQVFVFGWLARTLSTAAMLAIMPVLSVVGFLVLGAVPVLAVLVTFGVPRRAVEFALTKPTRETLFNPLSREEKYKSKNFIDTVVHRGGDALAGWLSALLRAGGASFAAISLAGAALAALWIGVALTLGRRHDRLHASGGKGLGEGEP